MRVETYNTLHFRQNKENDCGIAAIKTILMAFGRFGRDTQLKKRLFHTLSDQGLSLENIKEALGTYAIEAKTYEVIDINAIYEANVPFVLMVKQDGLPHYIVVHEVGEDNLIISNPAHEEVEIISKKEIEKNFMNYSVVVDKVLDYTEKEEHINFYKNIVESLTIKDKVSMIFLKISKTLFPLGMILFVQYLLIDRLDTMDIKFLLMSTIFFLSLLMIYFKIVKSDMRISEKIGALIQKQTLKIYYEDQIDKITEKYLTNQKIGDFWTLLMSVTGIIERFYSKVDIIVVIIYLFITAIVSPIYAMIIVLLSIIFIFLARKDMKKIVVQEEKWKSSIDSFSKDVTDVMSSKLDIKLFGSQTNAREQLDEKMEKYIYEKQLLMNVEAKITNLFDILYYGGLFLGVIVAAMITIIYQANFIQQASMGFLSLFMLTIFVKPLIGSYVSYEKSKKTLEYINDIIIESSNNKNAKRILSLETLEKITLSNISKKYEDKVILKDTNLSLERGKITALVGGNGVGKTTLAKIILGLESNDGGEIILNDIIKEDTLKDTNIIDYIAMYNQDLHLYHSTISNNVDYKVFGKEPQNSIRKTNFIFSDYEKTHVVFTGGNNLSQGQKQKILLQRTLQQDKDMYVFDEPNINLDKESSQALMAELQVLAKEENKMVLIITHDSSLFEICDDILYLGEEN